MYSDFRLPVAFRYLTRNFLLRPVALGGHSAKRFLIESRNKIQVFKPETGNETLESVMMCMSETCVYSELKMS